MKIATVNIDEKTIKKLKLDMPEVFYATNQFFKVTLFSKYVFTISKVINNAPSTKQFIKGSE